MSIINGVNIAAGNAVTGNQQSLNKALSKTQSAFLDTHEPQKRTKQTRLKDKKGSRNNAQSLLE